MMALQAKNEGREGQWRYELKEWGEIGSNAWRHEQTEKGEIVDAITSK